MNAASMIRTQLSEARYYLRVLESKPTTDDAEIFGQSRYIEGLEDALSYVEPEQLGAAWRQKGYRSSLEVHQAEGR